MTERIAKFLSRSGICSRREAERWILDGRVCVNGVVLQTPAVCVTPTDTVHVDGAAVSADVPFKIWTFFKPTGLVTTHQDEKNRKTVFEHIKMHPLMESASDHVISVGRLDLNSEGLLILTNNGAFSRYAEHPETAWQRVYRVRVFGKIEDKALEALSQGAVIDGVRYRPASIALEKKASRFDSKPRHGAQNHWVSITLTEGKNREIRRMMEHIDLQVNRLIRTGYGPFSLNDLNVGDVREENTQALSKHPLMLPFFSKNNDAPK